MTIDILTSLGAGSGIDVKNLVAQLTEAERAPRQSLIDGRAERVEARVSALSTFRASLDALVSGLGNRISSGTLSGQASVSDPSALTLTVEPGTLIPRQNVEVQQLARAQTLSSSVIADAAAPIGQGMLTIRFGAVAGTADATGFTAGSLPDLSIAIGPGQDSLAGIRDAINSAAAAAGSAIQAQILTDGGGSRLVLRGDTGEASGFIVEASGDAALQQFAFHPGSAGLARAQTAADARISLEGVVISRATNSISDLIPGATIDLHRAQPGTIVQMAAERSTAELTAIAHDLAVAFTEMMRLGRELTAGGSATSSAGALASDSNIRRALASLRGIASVELLPPDGDKPTRLLDIGIGITREGNFAVDETRLAKAIADHPEMIEALIAQLAQVGDHNVEPGPLSRIAKDFAVALDGSNGRKSLIQTEREAIAREQEKLETYMEGYTRRMTMQFSALDQNVSRYKSIQNFMQQQIDLWTKDRN